MGSPRDSRRLGVRERLLRMARIVADYATPWRLLMLGLAWAGLLVASLAAHPLVRGLGVTLATVAIGVLLAQLHRRIGTGSPSRPGAAREPSEVPGAPTQHLEPLVSVVIATRNESRFAARCVRGLQAQSLERFEAIIVDDASTDATLEALFDAIGDDPRFRVLRTGRSIGAGPAREHGAAAAAARHVLFLDLAEELAPEALATRLAEAERRADASAEGPRPTTLAGSPVARPVRRPRLVPVTEATLGGFLSGRPFLLLPAAAYHTDELIELVDELRARGFGPVAMIDRRHWRLAGTQLARVDVPALEALPAGEWLHRFEGLLTFNDWANYYGEYVRHVQATPTISFAKVEGVQDWLDHDTGRTRHPYLASDVVLCQGDNDVRALEGRRDNLEVVGSSRLQRIWEEPLPADAPPRVVGNVNFTYDVQTEHRDLWVESLREACERAGLPLDLSLHPADRSAYREIASDQPLRHLVTTDSILVSRFSTVLFEGMARGCSVVYYNPHGERVPTFQDPNGAFDVATDLGSLVAVLRARAGTTRAAARERARRFFLDQVSIAEGASPAVRTADAIERRLDAATRLDP